MKLKAGRMVVPGYPLQRENSEMAKKNPWQGKHRAFGNVAKTQGILFAQVVNSLILKVKDVVIFAVKISIFSQKLEMSESQFCVFNSHKLSKLAQGTFVVGPGPNRDNRGNFKIQFEWVSCSTLP